MAAYTRYCTVEAIGHSPHDKASPFVRIPVSGRGWREELGTEILQTETVHGPASTGNLVLFQGGKFRKLYVATPLVLDLTMPT